MKKLLFSGAILLAAVGANAQTLSLASAPTVTLTNGLYNYSYLFNVTGPAGTAITDIFLSADDLAPLNLTISKNNAPAPAWSLLSNDTPYSYLDFNSLDASGNALDSLTSGDQLRISFSDSAANFVPLTGHFAAAYDATSGGYSARVTGLVAPSAVPEPGVAPLLAGLLAAGSGLLLRRRK